MRIQFQEGVNFRETTYREAQTLIRNLPPSHPCGAPGGWDGAWYNELYVWNDWHTSEGMRHKASGVHPSNRCKLHVDVANKYFATRSSNKEISRSKRASAKTVLQPETNRGKASRRKSRRNMASAGPLADPYTLPCGLTLPNRLVKAALAEGLASSDLNPNDKHATLYGEWAHGGWGAVVTGNVQVDDKHLGTLGDVTSLTSNQSQEEQKLKQWTKWAQDCQSQGTPTLVQIVHPGRQASRLSRKEAALAPSAIPLNLGEGIVKNIVRSIVFGAPKEMTAADIETVVGQFQRAAQLSHQAGFKGVELHAAHGYLLAQFLSPLSNTRQDAWGGTPAKRAKIVCDVVEAIRQVVPKEFAVGIKINSADHQQENGLADCLEQVQLITQGGGVDFLEISGGTYENPRMVSDDWEAANEGAESQEVEVEPRAGELKATERTAKREAFFLEYAHQVREKFPDLPLMVTGGFRTRSGMRAALEDGGCDLVGLGRPSIPFPRLPVEIILNEKVSDDKAATPLDQIKIPWLVKATGIKPLTAGLVSVSPSSPYP
ncbi:hypothetical protein FH972_023877 [Carpinus fangiana]|uniref:NADH:flavin oxidoreductase/NADH oxidase N-terminal domain-containing protein n=1 Tax=Carpinus fangiana TaxID=176857 RepID=A0A5N6KWG8_9ROSI|nr:hypothetical protein FH972_023877 [Carpinus fangiana]